MYRDGCPQGTQSIIYRDGCPQCTQSIMYRDGCPQGTQSIIYSIYLRSSLAAILFLADGPKSIASVTLVI